MRTKLLTLFVPLIFATGLFAYDCKIDGIYYNLNSADLTAEVTHKTDYFLAESYSGLVTIPSTITYNSQFYSVTTIGDYAFSGCSGLTSVTIPNSVTTIGNGVFRNCSGLTSITIPNSVTMIGDESFYGCDRLKSVIINSGAIVGKSYNNSYDTGMNLIFGRQVEEYTIGDSVTTIGDFAFHYCSSLTSVTIPNSVTTIGRSSFSNCSDLISITIPISVTTIGDWAFSDCYSLTSVTIPKSVTTIGNSAFNNCTSLTSVTIPNSIKTIGEYAFGLVNNIVYSGTAVGSPWGAKCVNGHVDGCLVYNDDSKTILCGCSSAAIGKITIPNSVTAIGSFAFFQCADLSSITIGNSVTTMGYYAFWKCSSLTSITCYAVTPPTCGEYIFEDINQDAKVYVPASALTDYQNAKEWKDMQLFPIAANVTPMDDENPIVTPSNQDVTITWPITDGTDTYTLTITKNGETVCVLTFNANGQLTNIAFAAPSHNGAHQAPAATLTAQGYQFTVTGLNPGTTYDYSVTATDAGGKTLAEHKGNFSTTGGTGFKSVHDSQCTMHKYFHNGNLIIERNGVKYTPAGQKVQ